MISTFSSSFFCVFTSVLTLFKSELRRYVIIPLLINISLFSLTLYYVITEFSSWMDSFLPSWLDWLSWLIIPIFTVTVLIVVFYTFTIVANIIAAPFNSLLSEKYEQLLRGETDSENDETTMQLIVRTVSAEIKKITYIFLWLIPLIIISFIPILNLITPALWVLFAIWMLSLEYLDYPMGNNNLLFPEIKQTVHQQKSMTIGLGSGLFILTTIPFVNFIAIPAGVVAATKVYVDNIDKKD